MSNNYRILDSTSELKIRVFGDTLADLFSNALKAMFHSIGAESSNHNATITHTIELTAPDRDLLLVDFLSEAVFYADAENEAFFDVKFDELSEHHLKATIIGQKVKTISIEIKAVTYHDVHIVEKNGQLTTDILFDI